MNIAKIAYTTLNRTDWDCISMPSFYPAPITGRILAYFLRASKGRQSIANTGTAQSARAKNPSVLLELIDSVNKYDSGEGSGLRQITPRRVLDRLQIIMLPAGENRLVLQISARKFLKPLNG